MGFRDLMRAGASGKAARVAAIEQSQQQAHEAEHRRKFGEWMNAMAGSRQTMGSGQTIKPGRPTLTRPALGAIGRGTDGNEWVWDGLNWIPRPVPPKPEPEPMSDTEYRNSKWSDEDV